MHYTKYLFYKGLFLGKIGDFKNSHRYIEEALRKAPTLPEGARKQQGLKNYYLLVKKHHIVLDLLMNQLPMTETFEGEPKLDVYKEMVKLVSNGHK